MATDQTNELIEEIIVLIDKAIEGGDSVSAIAERSKVSRAKISRIRNRSMRFDEFPKIETIERLAMALGKRLKIRIE